MASLPRSCPGAAVFKLVLRVELGKSCAQGGVREHGLVPKGRKGEWREVNTSDGLTDCGTRFVLCVFRAPYVRTAHIDRPMVECAWGTSAYHERRPNGARSARQFTH